MSEKEGKTNKRVNHEQFYDLVQWVAKEGERLMQEKPTYTEAARQAEKVLGFGIYEGTFSLAMKKAGIQWETPWGGGNSYTRLKAVDVQALHAKNRQQDADIAYLRGLVYHLYKQLAAEPPKGVTLPPSDGVYTISPREQNRVSGHQ